MTTEEMLEFLFERRAPNLPPVGLAEIFDRLLWCMDDNGSEVDQVIRKWVTGDNETKVRIALAMTEMYPAKSRDELIGLFATISMRWPDLQATCDAILDSWDRTMKRTNAR